LRTGHVREEADHKVLRGIAGNHTSGEILVDLLKEVFENCIVISNAARFGHLELVHEEVGVGIACGDEHTLEEIVAPILTEDFLLEEARVVRFQGFEDVEN
jgi:hypothetical protein